MNSIVWQVNARRKHKGAHEVGEIVGDAISLRIRIRMRIKGIFGWTKGPGVVTQLKLRGLAKVNAAFTFGLVAYNIVRLPKLLGPPVGGLCPAGRTVRVNDFDTPGSRI